MCESLKCFVILASILKLNAMNIRLLLLGLVTVCLTSCAGYTNVTVPSSPVVMKDGDYVTDRYVECCLQNTYVLGLGGYRTSNLVGELVKKANLKKNESLAYISAVKNVNCFLGLVTVVTHKVSGYVVRPESSTFQRSQGTCGLTAEEAAMTNMINSAKYESDFAEIRSNVAKQYKAGKITAEQRDRFLRLLEERKASVNDALNGRYNDGMYR